MEKMITFNIYPIDPPLEKHYTRPVIPLLFVNILPPRYMVLDNKPITIGVTVILLNVLIC
jgi:hypothetical protein